MLVPIFYLIYKALLIQPNYISHRPNYYVGLNYSLSLKPKVFSDNVLLILDSQTFDDAQAEDSYEIGTSKLRKITDSPIFSEQVYCGKKTTRKKTYSLSETSNNGISESASFDER